MHRTGSPRLAWFLAALFVTWVPATAFAQVDMVVRFDDAPSPEIRSALDAEGALSDVAIALPDELFHGVLERRRLFERGTRRTAPPIDAYVITVEDSSAYHRLRTEWESTPGVAYVDQTYTYWLDDPHDIEVPHQDSLSHLDVIRAREAWSITPGSSAVTIGFVDTGLYFDHPDLVGEVHVHASEDAQGDGECQLYPVEEGGDFTGHDDAGNGYVDDVCGYNFVQRASSFFPHELGRGADPSEDLEHGHPHGTAVAGVLSAALAKGNIAGVAPGTTLIPLRAFDTRGQGRDTEISEAIVYAADMGVDVLNMSFGEIYHSPLLREAVEYAASQGVVLVASAGNQGNNDPHFPSDFDDVISVAWLNEDGTDRTPFSSYGPHLDLGAPSSRVYTTSLPDDDGTIYRRFSGSSFAAPQVAGAAGLLLSIDNSLTPEGIRNILTRSAHPLRGGWNDRTGAGRLDVASALANVLPGRVEITEPTTDDGVVPGAIPILGSAIDASFESYTLEYSVGEHNDDSAQTADWQEIAHSERQVLNDTLAVWNSQELPDGQYTIRLSVNLQHGETLIAHNRVFMYRTPPEITLHLVGEGISGKSRAIMADVETDDISEIEMRISNGSREHSVKSDRKARRHGLIWRDDRGDAKNVHLEFEATNAAGLQTTTDTTIELSQWQLSRHLFEEKTLNVPSGHLLPFATDFDGDGLKELALSPYENGVRTDTLAFYEWQGDAFARVHELTSERQRQVIPRDVNETCAGNGGQQALLFTSIDGSGLFVGDEEGDFPTEELDLNEYFSNEDDLFGIQWIDSEDGQLLVDWQTDHFRLLNCSGGSYHIADLLENPTPVDQAYADSNRFDVPNIHAADLTGNDHNNLLAGDSDGDWIMYENTAHDNFDVNWEYITDRTQAGSVFASGQFFDDESRQFITHNRAWPTTYRADSLRLEQEPPIHAFYLWKSDAQGEPQLQDRFLIAGTERSADMQAVDLSGDGQDEIALLISPHLYVLSASGGTIAPIFHRGPQHGADNYIDGDRLVAEDISGGGQAELIVPARDGQMRHFAFQESTARHPPPRWVEARPNSSGYAYLEWRASSADSVHVFGSAEGGPLMLLATTRDSSIQIPSEKHKLYRLRAWYGSTSSALSEAREVITADPTIVKDVRYPDSKRVNVIFTEAIHQDVDARQFELKVSGITASGLTKGTNGRGVYLRFDEIPASRRDTLQWSNVEDTYRRTVKDTQVAVEFPRKDEGSLIVESWQRTGDQTVMLTFSAPVRQSAAEETSNYEIAPTGYVESAEWSADAPSKIHLNIAGTRIGATGREVLLHVLHMQSETGEQLAAEGHSINLNEMAEDLADVYIYPNPHHERRHSGPVRIAGLPAEARVLILSIDGQRIAEFDASAETGGAEWNRDDMNGQHVPPGVYIVRIDAPGESPVLRNIAIIR